MSSKRHNNYPAPLKGSLSFGHNELGVSSAIDDKAGTSLFNHIYDSLVFSVYSFGFSFGQNANKDEIILSTYIRTYSIGN